jgi:epsilon-lactone hydrolase
MKQGDVRSAPARADTESGILPQRFLTSLKPLAAALPTIGRPPAKLAQGRGGRTSGLIYRSCSLVAAFGITTIAAAEPVRHVPAYDLPAPSTVSPEFQDKIAKALPSIPPASMPTTNAGWDAFFNPDPAKTHSNISKLLTKFKLVLREKSVAGVHCYVITPSNPRAGEKRLLMNLHGGAYTGGAGEGGVLEAVLVAGATRIETVAVDYRMPPSYPFPAAIDDAITVWREISQHHPGYKMGIFGTSSGGGMVLAVTQRAIKEHLRVPDAIMAGTPWSDLSETGDSYYTNRYADPVVYEGELSVAAKQYANGIDLKDPRLSPIYGAFSNFPPTLLLAGTRDLFLSNTVRVDRKLRDAGRRSELIVYEGQSHASYLSGIEFPETMTALRDISAFFSRELK